MKISCIIYCKNRINLIRLGWTNNKKQESKFLYYAGK